jgi:arginine:pyruvate transaminase
MKLSDRITNLETAGDDGWGVHYRSRDMARAGVDVISLCVGDHDTQVSTAVIDEMVASARAGNTKYSPVQGSEELRDHLAADYGVKRENVAVVSGGQAGLFAALCAAIDPAQTVVAIDPHYATYPSTVRGAGGIFITAVAQSDEGFQPQRAALESAAKGARALMINSPNNPTGAVYTRDTMEMIADVCIKNDLWLISDEVYATQVHVGEHISPRDLPNMADRTIIVGSFSKSHLMTGFRIGWVVAPENVIDALLSMANATTYGTPQFIQDAALKALQLGGADRVSAMYKQRRDLAVAAFENAPISLVAPQGAMYVMVDVRPTGLSGDDFANQLLDAQGIAVMPGESFGLGASGHIRIALTVDNEKLTNAFARIISFSKGFVS